MNHFEKLKASGMRRSLIVAMTPQFVIGRSGDMPWKLSADLQRFKKLTMGHHLLMGRKTYESIGRPLPGRTTIIITRQANYLASAELPVELPTVKLAGSLAEAFALAGPDEEAFVVGGGDVYRQALPLVDRVYATWVNAELTGDTYFPSFPGNQWREVESQTFPADERNEYSTRFVIYDRISADANSE
jgi:dihydrofolate reductase